MRQDDLCKIQNSGKIKNALNVTYDSNVQREKVSQPLKGSAANRRRNRKTKTEASTWLQTLELKQRSKTKKKNMTFTIRLRWSRRVASLKSSCWGLCIKNLRKYAETQTHSPAFALCAGQQLCLVQMEEQLMNQTHRSTIHICWHSAAAAGFARPRPDQPGTIPGWSKTHMHPRGHMKASDTSCKDSRQPPVRHPAVSKRQRQSCCMLPLNEKALTLHLMSTPSP